MRYLGESEKIDRYIDQKRRELYQLIQYGKGEFKKDVSEVWEDESFVTSVDIHIIRREKEVMSDDTDD